MADSGFLEARLDECRLVSNHNFGTAQSEFYALCLKPPATR